MLDGRAHQSVDQLFHNHLARDYLRDFDHGRQIQVFDMCSYDARGTSDRLLLLELRVLPIELAHFTVGSPPQVAVPGISEVEACNLLETARRVETGSEFVGERFVMKEAVCSGRADRPFVEPHRLGIATLVARELGPDQRGAIFEVFREVPGPLLELAMPRRCGSTNGRSARPEQ